MVAGGGPWGTERHGLARRTAEGTRAVARHGDGEGVRTDRQGRELGGHLPGAELGPLGRAFSSALREQETPVARLRRLDPPRGSHAPSPTAACIFPRTVSSPEPPSPPRPQHGPATLCPHWSTPPLLPCLDRTTSGPLPLSPGEGGELGTPHPTPAHFLYSGLCAVVEAPG